MDTADNADAVTTCACTVAARRTGWKWSVDHDERATPGS